MLNWHLYGYFIFYIYVYDYNMNGTFYFLQLILFTSHFEGSLNSLPSSVPKENYSEKGLLL